MKYEATWKTVRQKPKAGKGGASAEAVAPQTIERIAAAVRAAAGADEELAALRVLSAAQVAKILGRSKSQLEAWRAQSRETGRLAGPPFLTAADGRTIGYPLVGLIDWIVRNTMWGDEEDITLLSLAGETDNALPWRTARRALSLLLPVADALGLGSWYEEREALLGSGWREPDLTGPGAEGENNKPGGRRRSRKSALP